MQHLVALRWRAENARPENDVGRTTRGLTHRYHHYSLLRQQGAQEKH